MGEEKMTELTNKEFGLSLIFSISVGMYLLVTSAPLLNLPDGDSRIFILIILFTTPIWLMIIWTMGQIKK